MEPATEKMLARITEIIVKEIDPRQIILFGSQARGTPHPDSDFDFLIVQDRPFGPAQDPAAGDVQALASAGPFSHLPGYSHFYSRGVGGLAPIY